MLNGLWLSFFLVAAVAGFSRWLIGDDPAVFGAMVESLFAMAKLSVGRISLPSSSAPTADATFRPSTISCLE
ncbi:hypothetical protein JHC42_04975 [Pseudomonas sp. OA3]|nr:hypothetical protein [Pseudomonas sp. OA3]